MTAKSAKKVIGVGSPVVDLLARVEEDFVVRHAGTKGGMELVEADRIIELVNLLESEPSVSAGGSAANTIFALAKLQMPASFVGKLGNDPLAKEYVKQFRELKGDCSRFKFSEELSTARCLSLITEDYERTMRTCLAAAATMAWHEIEPNDFLGFDLAHFEGYLLFNKDLILSALKSARAADCMISLDLGSFEVVKAAGDDLPKLLNEYVDIVFANEEEARAFTGDDDLDEALDELSKYCSVAAVKLGAKGAMIKSDGEKVVIDAEKADSLVDTTGAGDYWAAGFLYGYLNGLPLKECGELGAKISAEVVQQLGADLPADRWQKVLTDFRTRLNK